MTDQLEPGRPEVGPAPTAEEEAAAESVAAQLDQVRMRLVRDALAMGLGEPEIVERIEFHAKDYCHARVHGFVGVLVERAVRQELSIRVVRR